jgi:hypothetical protein
MQSSPARPLVEYDSRDGTGVPAYTDAELAYARLLYGSGCLVERIATLIGQPVYQVDHLIRRHGWTRATPHRINAPFGVRVPVLVRCQACSARFGEEMGKGRPCPHCGSTGRDGE